jgi:hypothetical protein
VFRFFLRQNSALAVAPLRERISGLLEAGLGDKNPQTAAAAASALAVYAPSRLRDLAQQSGPAAELAKATLAKLGERHVSATAPTATKEA